MRHRGSRRALVAVAALTVATACSSAKRSPDVVATDPDAPRDASPSAGPTPTSSARTTASPSGAPTTTPGPTAPPVVVAAGDLATCDATTDEMTAELVAGLEGTVLTLGDHAYPNGTAAEFANCYGPSWGRFVDRTRPVLGNHDYHTDLAAPYFAYFGPAAGTPGEGWYSFDVGEWHVVALNSNCELVGCSADSPQGAWLAADLAANPTRCTLALMHHPRWSSGPEGDQAKVAALFEILYEAGADVVLSGHAHMYERLAPMDPDGVADPQRGVRQFVAGTGGRSLYGFGPINPNSEVRSNASFGVLRLVLRPAAYDWEFLPAGDGTFRDADSDDCH